MLHVDGRTLTYKYPTSCDMDRELSHTTFSYIYIVYLYNIIMCKYPPEEVLNTIILNKDGDYPQMLYTLNVLSAT